MRRTVNPRWLGHDLVALSKSKREDILRDFHETVYHVLAAARTGLEREFYMQIKTQTADKAINILHRRRVFIALPTLARIA